MFKTKKVLSFTLIACLIIATVYFYNTESNDNLSSENVANNENLSSVSGSAVERPTSKSEYGTEAERERIDRLTIADDGITEYDGYIVSFKDDSSIKEKYITVDEPYDVLKNFRPDDIEFIEPDYIIQLFSFPSDDNPDDTDYKNGNQWALDMVKTKSIWTSGYSGEGVLVGVMDSGLHTSHEDIADIAYEITSVDGRVSATETMKDVMGHGTGVTGVISAVTNNGKGVASPAYKSDIASLRVFDGKYANTSDMVKALKYLFDNDIKLDVLNMSIGGTGYDLSFQNELDRLAEEGTILIAANGNDGEEGSPLEYPANYSSVIGIGSVDKYGKVSDFSSRNTAIEFSAPGSNIRTIYYTNNSSYDYSNGTSFSSPMVAAAAAIVKEIDPSTNVEQFRTLMIDTVSDAGINGYDLEYGNGILDLEEMMKEALTTSPGQLSPTYSINYNPGAGSIASNNEIVTSYKQSGETVDLPVAVHPDEDATFLGWCENSDLSDSPVFFLPAGSRGNKNLYAKFEVTDKLNMSYQTGAVNIYRNDSQILAKSNDIIVAKANASEGLIITGKTDKYPVRFMQNDEKPLNVTIENLDMDLKNSPYYFSASGSYPDADYMSPFLLSDYSHVNMTISGKNKLVAGSNDGCIAFYDNTPSLILDGTGTLYVEGNKSYSAIGAGCLGDSREKPIGNITINGGVIEAKSQNGTAIGASKFGSSDVKINGGYITATGKNGIYTTSTVYINGGSVESSSISPQPKRTDNTAVYKVDIPLINNGVTNYGSKTVKVLIGSSDLYSAKTISNSGSSEHGTGYNSAATIYLPVGIYDTIQIGEYKEGHVNVVSSNPTSAQNKVYWDYKAFLNVENGTLNTNNTIPITNGSKYNIENPSPPDNMIFMGWYTQTDGDGQLITKETTVDVKESINLYAYYSDSPNAGTVMVNFANQYKANECNLEYNMKSVNPGEKYDTLPKASMPGYTFVGWYLNSECIGERVTEESTVNIGIDFTLYPKFTLDTYAITYKTEGGKFKTSTGYSKTYTIEQTRNGKIVLPDASDISRSGYNFGGWYSKPGGNGSKFLTITKGKTGNITFYAKWTPVKITVPKASIKSAKNTKKKKVKITIKNVSGAKGYQISYSLHKKFKKSKTKTKIVKNNSVTLKNFIKGKTYYIKVRAYKLNHTGKKIYGKFSKVKKLKIKK